jgi:hypothetical protein
MEDDPSQDVPQDTHAPRTDRGALSQRVPLRKDGGIYSDFHSSVVGQPVECSVAGSHPRCRLDHLLPPKQPMLEHQLRPLDALDRR